MPLSCSREDDLLPGRISVWSLGYGARFSKNSLTVRLKSITIQIANLVLTGLLLFKDFEDTTGRQICAVALFTSGLKRKREGHAQSAPTSVDEE